jgi:SAM-dependent methyltransferase
MRPEEAHYIGSLLSDDDVAGKVALNVGSSTGHFREVTQPHIEREIFAPLRAKGARVIHCDMKAADGVDLVGDLLDPSFRDTVIETRPDFVLANNLFEHVRDRQALADCLATLPAPGGRLIVSVPYAYPYHADPIDTLYRPTPDEIATMFPQFRVESARIVKTTSLWTDLVAKLGAAGALKDVAWRFGRLAVPFVRPRAWLATGAGLAWLLRERSVSVVSLVRDGASGEPA